jgi:hypothetical protein
MAPLNNMIILVFVLAFTGCVTYEIPEGMPSAKIRFTAGEDMTNVALHCPDDRHYVKQGLINNPYWHEISPVKMYGTREDKNNKVLERLIPAERTVAFSMSSARPGIQADKYRRCEFIFEFTPNAGQQYQADFLWIGDKCGVNLVRLSKDNGSIQRTEVPVKMHDWSTSHTCE